MRFKGINLWMAALVIAGQAVPVQGWQHPAVAQSGINVRQKSEADRLFNQGTQQYQANQFAAALQSLQQAVALYREIADRPSEGRALGNLGLVYLSLGNYPKALDCQTQRLAITREFLDKPGEAQALGNLGNVHHRLGNYAKAIDYHTQSLALARERQDKLSEGQSLGNLGSAHQALGNYAKAIEYQTQFLAIARQLKNPDGESNTLSNLGNSYASLGNYPKAIEFHTQSLAIARTHKNRLVEGIALSNLGGVYQALGNYPQAIASYEQVLGIARALKNRYGEAVSLGGLGLAYQSLGDSAKAIEFQTQHLALARELKDRRGEEQALGNLGVTYKSLKNYPKAIEFQQQRLAIAQEIKDRQGAAQAFGNLGNAYLNLGDFAKAVESQEKSLALVREIQDRPGVGIASANLGVALFASNQLTAAEAQLRASIAIFESLRVGLDDQSKISIATTQAVAYQVLQQVLIKQQRADAALEVAERARGRALVELLAGRLAGRSAAEIQKIAEAPNLDQIRRIAKAQNAILVEYSQISTPTIHELLIWVIKPTGEIGFRRVDTPANIPLATQVADTRNAMGARGRASIGIIAASDPGLSAKSQSQQLQDLHRLLIAPIADLLPTDPNQRVIFLPQGSLFLVPFPALQDPQGKYLIEQHTLSTAPSIQTLALTHEQRQPAPGLPLVVGNPTMPSQGGLAPLPGAEREALAVAQLLNTTALTGSQATKAAVLQRLGTASVVHLATHGLLETVKGAAKGDLPGAIALAPSGSDSGFLTASEIFDLRLKANLVVLSACDTGRGDITGDGVIGLSRSFVAAGVPSLVVSLWAVNDDATSALMREFYRQLQTHPNQAQDKAQALRQAMLVTLKQYPQPLDWAAFTLIGEAQ
jgi:CHAT domain-containing protein